MAKFNEVQKKRRALLSEKKRQLHGDPNTGKLKNKHQPLSISGKRQRKLLKKWRRDQKEALEKGLVTMEDVEMAVAEAEGSSQNSSKSSMKIHLKKGLKLKQLKQKGKNKRKRAAPAAGVSADADVAVDAMVE
ncbi:uncharacterized protein LOC114734652 [Neltuma alba]|uniref:uncharacterized protein LOC114734652 n=1 Tax=Neltuma alba TaxID=207710 RepID=UPI0010A4BDEC|nr:uncharacterized protein LOC114734652 [Prosopis alba]